MIAVEQELTPGDPTSVGLGRTVVDRTLRAQPLGDRVCPDEVLDDAVLAASELITNAVAAAQQRIRLLVDIATDRARISVYDDGPGEPTPVPPSPDRANGRGLTIVQMLAARWGVESDPPGKWVWADFPLEEMSVA